MIHKIAIPVFGNRVSSRLDCSESILLVSVDDRTILRRQETGWQHLNSLERVQLLLQEGVEVLICGGLTETCARMLQETGIEVTSWVRGEVEEVLFQYLHGILRAAIHKNKRISS
jgi:predicted Fe-Mo cluster-binding NifX family protein